MPINPQLQDLISQALSADGLELWDIEQVGSTLRISVERQGGIDLDSLSEASRQISALLDEREDLSPSGHYDLEVTSPGLERRLRTAAHFRRYIGQQVAVKTTRAIDGTRRFKGTIADVSETGFGLRPAEQGEELSLDFGQVERANLVLDWGTIPKGGNNETAPAQEQVANKEKL